MASTSLTAALTLVTLAGTVCAQPAPRPLAVLDVPFISQSEALCGGAAAAMVLRYWGERSLNAESFAHLVDRSAAGIRTDRLVGDLRARGWTAEGVEGTSALVDMEMTRGRPVVTLIEDRPGTFHYVVVVATTLRAIVFHDPARSPFRVMDRGQFEQRWSAARRWMAVIVPGASTPAPAPAAVPASGESSCSGLVATGVRQAQATDLEAAERSLTMALSCGGSAPLRELAGVRLLQQRWSEMGELAAAAVAIDETDTLAWQLLATSRFLRDDPAGALPAWNRIDQPHVDLVAVGGLTRTRQRVVEQLLDVTPRALLTPQLFTLTARRLRELPSASTSRLEYLPSAGGLAELRAHVVERPLVPTGLWSYAAIGLLAAARNEVGLTMGSLTGGGERVSAGWRFWPERPRVDLDVVSPAPWGGLWAVDVFGERQPFSSDVIPAERRIGAGLTISNWIAPWLRASVRGGVDSWRDRGRFGSVFSSMRVASMGERAVADVEGTAWTGDSRFGSFAAAIRLQSSTAMQGRSVVVRGGFSTMSALTPPDLWLAGDTGRTRPVLLRAHPVIDDGRLDVERIGRRIAHLSTEGRQWWRAASPIRIGAAAFVDMARVDRRLLPGDRSDVDVGLGLRAAVPGLSGLFRLDLAKGLTDGDTAVSFVYEP